MNTIDPDVRRSTNLTHSPFINSSLQENPQSVTLLVAAAALIVFAILEAGFILYAPLTAIIVVSIIGLVCVAGIILIASFLITKQNFTTPSIEEDIVDITSFLGCVNEEGVKETFATTCLAELLNINTEELGWILLLVNQSIDNEISSRTQEINVDSGIFKIRFEERSVFISRIN